MQGSGSPVALSKLFEIHSFIIGIFIGTFPVGLIEVAHGLNKLLVLIFSKLPPFR